MDGTLVASLVALYSVIVMTVMQLGLKTLLEQLPFMQPTSSQLHDAVLRLVVVGLNAVLIVVTALTTPAFTGLQWYDLLALVFGQSVISHGVYSVASTGPAPSQAVAVSVPGVFSTEPPRLGGPPRASASAPRFPTLADRPQPNTGPIPVFKPSTATPTAATNTGPSAQVAADVRANWYSDTPHDAATWPTPAAPSAQGAPDAAAAPSSGASEETPTS